MTENIVAKSFGRGYAYSFRMSRIYRKLKEAGGVAYEILQHSGLLELRRQKLLWNDFEDKLRANDVDGVHYGVALEVYVKHPKKETLDHIYLCAADLGRYQLLLEFGDIQAGKLVIQSEWLPKLAEREFHCIIPLGEEETGVEEAFYETVFDTHMRFFAVKPWRTQNISKNGFNLVLFNPVTMTERIETRLDLYALETAMRVLEQEAQIREYIDPAFYVERIDFGPWDDRGIPFPFWDDEVLDLMKPETKGVFLREVGLKVEDFPFCYRKLAYQTAYIKHYYPQLDSVVKAVMDAQDSEAESLGIELDFDVSRGAYCCSDKEIRLVQRRKDMVDYAGCQSSYNAGLIVSEMGLLLQKIKARAELFTGVDMRHIAVCLPTKVITKESMTKSIERFRKNADKDREQKLSLQIYDELELSDCGTVGLVEKAAELAGIESVSIIPRALSIVAAYEHMDTENVLAGWENGLVLDWSHHYLSVSVVSRQNNEDVDILNQRIIRLPMGSLDLKDDLNHAFIEELHNSMYAELNKDGMLTYLDMDSEKKKVWDDFYRSSNQVIKQIMRCGYANLVFDEEGECPKTERYAELTFIELFRPYWRKAEEEIRKLLEEIQFSVDDISKVYLAGEWGNFPYLWQRINALFLGRTVRCTMADTTYAAVKGAAYLAKEKLDTE